MRINHATTAPDNFVTLLAVKTQLEKAFADPGLKALVELRISQINGCAYCVDLHCREARQHGETQQRLDCLCVWREVSFFTARECSALALAEAMTLLTREHVPEAIFAAARQHFTDRQLVDLITIIAMMNMWNRLSVTLENTPAAR